MGKHRTFISRNLLAGTALAIIGISAHAQAAEPAKAAAPLALPTLSVQDKADNGYVTKNVSVTKTDTPLIDTPQSIAVVNKQLIKDQSMQSIADVIRYVPGVGNAQGEGNRDNPIFRGNSSAADLFVDGIRDDVEYLRDLYNVERVEVLSGPNGMIFGRGGVGGALNRVTRQADGETIREVTLEGGSWSHKRATADVGQAINDAISLRVTGMYEKSDWFRQGSDSEKWGINPTLMATLGDNAVIHVSYEHYEYDRTADRGIPSFAGRPVATGTSTFFGDPDNSYTRANVDMLTSLVEYNFSDDLKLSNKTRVGIYNKMYQNIYANSALTGTGRVQLAAYNNHNDRRTYINQTDLTAKFDTGFLRHTFLAGVELSRQISDNRRDNGTFIYGGPVPLTSPASTAYLYYAPISNPLTPYPVVFSHVTTPANTPAYNNVITDSIGFYAQDQIEFNQYIQLLLGARVDKVKTDFDNLNTPTLATPAHLETNDTLFSPRIGLIAKPMDNMSLYASYALARLPRAGAQLASLTIANSVFTPEKWENLELGAKWDITPDLYATAAIYQLTRNNVIAATAVPGVSILVNGQRSKGLELGLTGHITPEWSIAAAYAYQNAKVLETQSATVVKGAHIGQVPQNTLALWNRYDFTEAFGAGVGVIHTTKQYVATEDIATPANNVILPGYTRFDAALFWTITPNVKTQLNVENVFNKHYYPNANSNNNITVGTPRMFRLSITTNF